MNRLRHFFNDFMTFVPLQLPQLLDVTTMDKNGFLLFKLLFTTVLSFWYESCSSVYKLVNNPVTC